MPMAFCRLAESAGKVWNAGILHCFGMLSFIVGVARKPLSHHVLLLRCNGFKEDLGAYT
jgi:hypothetical protein